MFANLLIILASSLVMIALFQRLRLPPVLGYLYDLKGNYTLGMIIFGGVAILGGIMLMPVKPRFWTPPSKRHPQESEVGVSSLRPARA